MATNRNTQRNQTKLPAYSPKTTTPNKAPIAPKKKGK